MNTNIVEFRNITNHLYAMEKVALQQLGQNMTRILYQKIWGQSIHYKNPKK